MNELKWDLSVRLRLIEIVALWEGRLTTNHLSKSFGIGRQQASKDIKYYKENIAPDNLQYDTKLKGYKPTIHFESKITRGTVDEYLYIVGMNKQFEDFISSVNLDFAHCEVIAPSVRFVTPKILQPIIQAIRERRRVEIEYSSLNTPEPEIRVIAPHALVCTSLRWHVRAYCEKNKDFRDFVLSRFRVESDIMDETINTSEQDSEWNEFVNVCIKPDDRLNEFQKQVIEQDYGMEGGCLKLKTRTALRKYLLQAYNLNENSIAEDPTIQQIILCEEAY